MKGFKTIGLDGVIRVLLVLRHDKRKTTTTISYESGYSTSAVECFISRLKTTDIIVSKKGPNGGYNISVPLEELVVGDIIHLVNRKNKATRIAFNLIKDRKITDVFAELS